MTGIEQAEKRTKIAVIGAGAMGQGIVQVSVQGGLQAYIFDREEGGAEAAKATIAKRLERLVEKERISQEACQQAISLVQPVSKLEEIADADFVVEAVFEDLQVKHDIFTKLENIVSENCIPCL